MRRWSSSPFRCWMLLMMAVLVGRQIGEASAALEEVLEHGPLFDEMEDEAWWSGVDMIDTSVPTEEWPPLGPVDDDDDDQLFCTGLAADGGCLDVDSHLRLPPPPPVPPVLTELVRQLNQLGQQPDNGQDQSRCLLCHWASLNGTVDLIPNSELSSENTWVPMLVVVALVSAMLGAVLMITALKCRRLKVLPRGGSCPTLPVGYMVGEGKDGVVQTAVDNNTMPKNSYNIGPSAPDVSQLNATLGRPRLGTPTLNPDGSSTYRPHQLDGQVRHHQQSTGWGVKLWRMVTGTSSSPLTEQEDDPYVGVGDQSDAISAVYAELNSVSGSVQHHAPSIYHLNTYSEIREPHHHHHHHLMVTPSNHHHHQPAAAQTLHLRRVLNDGTYENAGYALERGVVLIDHDAVSNSTPSSAYYSDLSNSDRSGCGHGGQHPLWHLRPPPRLASESQGSSHSLPHHQHCCAHHHHHHHQHTSSLQARDLMPITLQVIPDNQQIPHLAHHYPSVDSFSRGGVSASLNDSTKRPLPPLPSRQVQRPQRRYAYAVSTESPQPQQQPPQAQRPDGNESPLSCVPSEYV